jgi:hypothetical protein
MAPLPPSFGGEYSLETAGDEDEVPFWTLIESGYAEPTQGDYKSISLEGQDLVIRIPLTTFGVDEEGGGPSAGASQGQGVRASSILERIRRSPPEALTWSDLPLLVSDYKRLLSELGDEEKSEADVQLEGIALHDLTLAQAQVMLREYQRHLREADVLFKCTGCGRACSSRQSLQEHYLIHAGENPFVVSQARACEPRGKVASTAVLLTRTGCLSSARWTGADRLSRPRMHSTCIPSPTMGVACQDPSSARLMAVVRGASTAVPDHSDDTVQLTPSVVIRFSMKWQVKQHMQQHPQQQRFMCSIAGCGRRFDYRHQLLIHERAHTGKGPRIA